MTRHIVITGLPGTGGEALRDLLAREAEDVTVYPGDVPALSVLGQATDTCTHSAADLFATPEIALAAADRSIRLDLLVTVRDPRDLLLIRDPDGDYAHDGETLVLIQTLLTELDRAGIVTGEILVVRQEDIPERLQDVRDTITTRLGLTMRPAPCAPPSPDATDWRKPDHRARLRDQFRRHYGLHEVLAAQGYADSLEWFGALMVPDRAHASRDATPEPKDEIEWGNEMPRLYEDDALRVTLLDGPGDHAIVTFIGVGMATGGIDQQSEEFRKLGPGLGPQIFVFDKQRSWGNAIDMDRVIAVTAPYRSGREVTTLGLSMGGFLAIHASGPLGAARAIAFAPQYAMRPDLVPFEKRWRAYTGRIAEWHVPSLEKAFVRDCRYYAVFPDDPADRRHRALFPKAGNVHLFQLGTETHNVAATLKAHDLLYPTIWSCLRDAGPADMPFPSEAAGGVWQVRLGDPPAGPQASSSASQ